MMSEERNVSPAVWRKMCERSSLLLNQAELCAREGLRADAAAVWRELGPLNRRIRALGYRAADGS